MGRYPRTLGHAYLTLMGKTRIVDGHWVKQGTFSRPMVSIDGTKYLASRLVLSIHKEVDIHGPWLACHRCDNPECYNPRHLYVGDKSSNATDYERSLRRSNHR